jgi:hypothetical protein
MKFSRISFQVSRFAPVFAWLIVACLPVSSAWAQQIPAEKDVILPFYVFTEHASPSNHYCPSGWMGNTKVIRIDENCHFNPRSGDTCICVEYRADTDWGGVVWQDPPRDWGNAAGGWNLSGAKRLVFWARGDKGGETVGFRFGVIGADKKYYDTATGNLEEVELSTTWKEYSIDLSGKNLSNVKTGFVWIVVGQRKPVLFYLDEIRFE